MMDYRMFKEVAKDKVLNYLPLEMRNAEVLIADVWKVNQVREALRVVLPEQKKVLPNFYLDKLYGEYRKNRDIEAVIVELAEAVVAVNSVWKIRGQAAVLSLPVRWGEKPGMVPLRIRKK